MFCNVLNVLLWKRYLLIVECAMCIVRSFHWVLSAGGQSQLEDGLESPYLLGNVL